MLEGELTGQAAGYAVVFGAAGVACLASLRAVDRVEMADTRRGLWWLLVTVGLWSLVEGGRVLAPTEAVAVGLYMCGLVVGLSSVGAWLYFCSAYTGRRYHRSRRLRALLAGAFLVVVAVKLTNPLHGLYFQARVVTTPFPHVAVTQSVVHWVVIAGAYALSAVGFFMLFDHMTAVDRSTARLGGLVALSGLPVVANVVGAASPLLLELNYEPLGVAAFVVGVLYVADDAFLAVQRHGRRRTFDFLDEAVLVLDADDRVRDANASAHRLFPDLRERLQAGDYPPLSAVAPGVAAGRDRAEPVTLGPGRDRWVTVTEQSLTDGGAELGATLVLADVSATVRRRQELARQNQQFEEFAAAVTHELRNALTVVSTRLSVIDRRAEAEVEESVAAARRGAERATDIVDDLATLARQARTVEETRRVDFAAAVDRAAAAVAPDAPAVEMAEAGTVEAEEGRLLELLEHAVRFARENGADRVRVTLHDDGFAVADDGAPPPEGRAADLFEYGVAVPDAATGMLLPMVATLARVHGWTVTVDERYDDGVRYRVEGVAVEREERAPGPSGDDGRADPNAGRFGADADADLDAGAGPGTRAGSGDG